MAYSTEKLAGECFPLEVVYTSSNIARFFVRPSPEKRTLRAYVYWQTSIRTCPRSELWVCLTQSIAFRISTVSTYLLYNSNGIWYGETTGDKSCGRTAVLKNQYKSHRFGRWLRMKSRRRLPGQAYSPREIRPQETAFFPCVNHCDRLSAPS